MVAATGAALKGQRLKTRELVAEGAVVFARFNYFLILQDRTETMARTLAYYRLARWKYRSE